MARRHYGQSCSVASALDRIGERWSLLIVRELLLGPLRFSALARGVGGAPTDVLTRRLRDLEADGIVCRRELGPPAPATVYELTELGHQLEGTIIELGRWGLNFYSLEDLPGVEASWLPGALRVILQPPEGEGIELTTQLHSEDMSFRLTVAGGVLSSERGEATDPDLILSGPAPEVIKLLVAGEAAAPEVEVEGDRAALEALRAMVVLPEQLHAAALAEAGVPAPA